MHLKLNKNCSHCYNHHKFSNVSFHNPIDVVIADSSSFRMSANTFSIYERQKQFQSQRHNRYSHNSPKHIHHRGQSFKYYYGRPNHVTFIPKNFIPINIGSFSHVSKTPNLYSEHKRWEPLSHRLQIEYLRNISYFKSIRNNDTTAKRVYINKDTIISSNHIVNDHIAVKTRHTKYITSQIITEKNRLTLDHTKPQKQYVQVTQKHMKQKQQHARPTEQHTEKKELHTRLTEGNKKREQIVTHEYTTLEHEKIRPTQNNATPTHNQAKPRQEHSGMIQEHMESTKQPDKLLLDQIKPSSTQKEEPSSLDYYQRALKVLKSPPKESNKPPRAVLLLTRWRSGSTFVGEILATALPHTFYRYVVASRN